MQDQFPGRLGRSTVERWHKKEEGDEADDAKGRCPTGNTLEQLAHRQEVPPWLSMQEGGQRICPLEERRRDEDRDGKQQTPCDQHRNEEVDGEIRKEWNWR